MLNAIKFGVSGGPGFPFNRRQLLQGLGAAAGFPAAIFDLTPQGARFRFPVQNNGALAAGSVVWEGRKAQISGGAAHFRGLTHAIVMSESDAIVRLEVRNTPHDRRPDDRIDARRSEIAFPENRLGNGAEYWAALSIRPDPYTRPSSLVSTPRPGGPFFQVHADDTGSPSIALRRTPDDRLCVTTEGPIHGSGIIHRTMNWRLSTPHHFVLRFRLHPSHGALTVWMDGDRIIHAPQVPMGLHRPGRGSFIKIGCYYPRGLGPDPAAAVVNAFARYVPPGTTDLRELVTFRPAWPAS